MACHALDRGPWICHWRGVGGFAYSAASTAGLIAFESDIAFLSVLMAVVYMIATAAGFLRYR